MSTNSVQIQVVITAMSRQIAKATARTRPARLPRSHTQGSPGHSSVSERRNDTAAPAPGGNGNMRAGRLGRLTARPGETLGKL